MKNKKGKKTSASAERIRKAYEKSNEVSVEVIPAREKPVDDPDKVWRVCAYCRVSTDEESQQSSYELQVQHYRAIIPCFSLSDKQKTFLRQNFIEKKRSE